MNKLYTCADITHTVNARLEALGFKKIPYQMIRQYIEKGYIKGNAETHTASAEAVQAWFTKYLENKTKRATRETFKLV